MISEKQEIKQLFAHYYLQVSCLLALHKSEVEAFDYHYRNAVRLKNELKKVGVK